MGTSALTVESDMLAAARARLAAGDPRGALTEIARLGSQFPHGRLLQEREVVAIDSLEALGDNEMARARSTAFLKQFPVSPYAAHLRRILEP
jgi:outer membrane protein assembly factor BamD (BamD/ComL family)